MKIKTRLTLSVAIFALALLIIIGSVIVTNQQVDRLNKQEELAKNIEIKANELSYLSSDYILYRENQQAERWESKYSELASDLSVLTVDTPEQKELVTSLMENQQRLKQVFDEVRSGIRSDPQGDPVIFLAVVQVSWSRLAVQTQGIVFDAGRLSHMLRDETDQVKQVSNLLIFLLMGTFSLFILTSYLIVFRRTLTSIAELQDGVKVIGSGDLGHVIPEKGDDEIRDLSLAFNKMTVDLKGVTASKAELEQEVANRKKAEEALRKNEQRLNLSLEVSRMGTWDLDLVRHTAFRSLRHDQIFGYGELLPEWTYEMFLIHVTPEDREDVNRKFLDAIENKEDWNFECRILRKDGILRWIHARGRGEYDEGGKPVRMIGIVQDITERKQAEEAIRESEAVLRSFFDSSGVMRGIVEVIAEDDVRHIADNSATAAFIGITPEAMKNKTGSELGERRDVLRMWVSHYIESQITKKPVIFEYQDKRGDTVAWLHTTVSYLGTSPGGYPRFAYVILDITERKRAEEELLHRNEDLNAAYEEITATQEELQQSNDELIRSEQELRKTSQYLENLIDYANAPIVVWDPQFVITRFNHAFEKMTGRTAREIIGQRLEVLFPRQYLDASMAIIRKTMYGERLKVVEIPILNRRGEIRIVLWNSATLFEPDGTVQSTIAQGNDITERKMTEAELEVRNEELNSAIEELTRQREELNEALNEKEVLLSEVHHRVKNNLTAFISLLSLESTYDDSPAGLALKKDLQNRARSMALIHETLYKTKKYSRVNMDVYLSTLVGQVISSYESAKSIQPVVETHGLTLDLSRATPGGLIINELLTNSLKYAFPPSFDCEKIRGAPCTIEVSLIEDDGAYVLTVKDNGIGLPGNLDIATTKSLGLKLVNFLAKHQLRASVEIHSDDGAEFRFRFQDKV